MTAPLPVAILAGGLATRMRPVTEKVPKALLDVNGEPFVSHQLRLLASRGIAEVVLCLGYLGEQIRAHVGGGERFGLRVGYSFDGSRQLGTGGAVRRALPLLGESFFVLYGDSYLECDYRAVQEAFARADGLALMAVYRNEGRLEPSNVEFQDGRVVAYDKRHPTPAMIYIDYGLGAFRRAAFAAVPADEPLDLADHYRALVARGQLAGYEVAERFYEGGSPQGLAELRAHLRATSGGG